jgi:branched-chain amino acid transport system substrate-binding protein
MAGAAAITAVALAAGCGSSGGGKSNAGPPASSGAATSSGAKSSVKGPIKLGLIVSLSGAFAAYGPGSEATADAALAQINQDGGIAGQKVQVLVENDQSTPNGSLAAAQKLISEGVVGFLYIGTSPNDLSAAAVLEKSKIPMIGLLTDKTYEDGQKWKYIFNTYSDSKIGGTPYGPFVKNNLKVTKVGIIHDTSPASTAFASSVSDSITSSGIQVTKSVSFAPTAVDLTTEISQIKDSGAQALMAANTIDYPALYSGLKAVGWKPPMIVATAAYYDQITALGDLASTTYATCQVATSPGFTYPAAIQTQLKAVKAKLGVTIPDAVLTTVSYYDSMLMYKAAIEATGSTDGTGISNYMNGIKDRAFSLPSLKYTFSADNHAGLLPADNHICNIGPLDEFGTPPIVSQ